MLVGHVPYRALTDVNHDEAASRARAFGSGGAKRFAGGRGRVISRAMAKQPADRYQTVGELVEDLTIAAGVEVPAPTPVPMTAAANRIVVPTRTGENELLDDEALSFVGAWIQRRERGTMQFRRCRRRLVSIPEDFDSGARGFAGCVCCCLRLHAWLSAGR